MKRFEIFCRFAMFSVVIMAAISAQAEELVIPISSYYSFNKTEKSEITWGAIAITGIPTGDSIYIDYAELIIPISADVDKKDPLLLVAAPIIKSWTEGKVDWKSTWEKEDGDYEAKYSAIYPLSQSMNGKEIRIDVTHIVKLWRSGRIPNYGLFLKSAKENISTFSFIKDGRYNGANAKLRIVYCKP